MPQGGQFHLSRRPRRSQNVSAMPTPPLTLNLYSHLLDAGELPRESLGALLVWSPCGREETETAQMARLSH